MIERTTMERVKKALAVATVGTIGALGISGCASSETSKTWILSAECKDGETPEVSSTSARGSYRFVDISCEGEAPKSVEVVLSGVTTPDSETLNREYDRINQKNQSPINVTFGDTTGGLVYGDASLLSIQNRTAFTTVAFEEADNLTQAYVVSNPSDS